jgi:hypothetical protein
MPENACTQRIRVVVNCWRSRVGSTVLYNVLQERRLVADVAFEAISFKDCWPSDFRVIRHAKLGAAFFEVAAVLLVSV